MNPYQKHCKQLLAANNAIGRVVIGQKPGTYDSASRVRGILLQVREVVSDYTSGKPAEIMVDIQHHGTVTPCYWESIVLE